MSTTETQPTVAEAIQPALDAIRAEARLWRIEWADREPRETSVAWFVYCARRDEETTAVIPLPES